MAKQGNVCRFGLFQLDLENRELRREGRVVRLPDQSFEVLRLLVARPGELVPREQIRKALWSEDTFVDFDNSLNAAIAKLRSALGDTASAPRYIQTVPRRGYRFVAPVQRAVSKWEQKRKRTALGAVAALAVLAAATLVWVWRQDPGAEQIQPVNFTYYAGLEGEPTFSPDGSQLAFTWNGPRQDNFDIYVRAVGVGEPQRRTDHPSRDLSPAWSPDGRWLAYLRLTGPQRATIYKIPALGGAEKKVAEVHTGSRWSGGAQSNYLRYLCWTPDSRALVVSARPPDAKAASLYWISVDTGQQRRLTSAPDESLGDRNPALSSDGRTLVFDGSRGPQRGLFELQLDSEIRPVGLPEFHPLPGLYPYLPVSAGKPGHWLVNSHRKLWRVHLNGAREMTPLPLQAGRWWTTAAYSPVARRLAYTLSHGGDANLYRLPLTAGPAAAEPLKMTSTSGVEGNVHYSPDGKRVVFHAYGRDASLWLADANFTQETALTSLQGGSPRWSPNGTMIACDAPSSPDQPGELDIWLVDVAGGGYRRLVAGPTDDRLPNWSRNGRWVYFCRRDDQQIWKVEVETGREEQVTKEGGFYSQESPDGQYLYYTKAQLDRSVWRVPVEGGPERQVLEPIITWPNFYVTERGIYYTPRSPDGPSAIWFLDFRDDSKRLVFQPGKPLTNGLAATPDGASILFSLIDHNDSDIMLVDNFE